MAHLLSLVALVALLAVSSPGGLSPGGTFVDDDASVHEGGIEALVAAGVTAGCEVEPSRYCPDDPVTRGQMAVFLAKALDVDPATGPSPFVDDDGSPFEPAIHSLAAAGATAGCDEERLLYCPDDPVTRAEMASFLIGVLGDGSGFDPPADAFDDDEESVHEAAIDRLAFLGVTNGCGPRLFCPDRPVSRAEMATFLVKALGLQPLAPPPRPPVERVSSFTTYHACCEARVINIHVMADAIDGAVVYPGETFSVNEYLGPRTTAKGYVPAPILLNGEGYCCDHPLNIGGGTSQFGTTIYNAVFWGGYEVIDHKPHSRYIDRYPLGIEATLGYPWPDVVFRNDTYTPVTIQTSYTGTSITVELWGNALGRTVEADVAGSATYASGGSVEVVRTITESGGAVRSQTWSWTYLAD